MTRCENEPLRSLTEEECNLLIGISRSHTKPAAHVARAKAVVTVADGVSCTPLPGFIDPLNRSRKSAPNLALKLDQQPPGEGLIQNPVGDS